MKKAKYFLLIVHIFVNFCSCNDQNDKPNAGIKISIPNPIEIYSSYSGRSVFQSLDDRNKKFKIFTLLNASCPICISNLDGWMKFMSEIKNPKDVLITPVCYSHDNFELLKFAFENNKIAKTPLLIVLDSQNDFFLQNRDLASKYGDFTVLTDVANNVLLIGDPINVETDRAAFLKRLQNN